MQSIVCNLGEIYSWKLPQVQQDANWFSLQCLEQFALVTGETTTDDSGVEPMSCGSGKVLCSCDVPCKTTSRTATICSAAKGGCL